MIPQAKKAAVARAFQEASGVTEFAVTAVRGYL